MLVETSIPTRPLSKLVAGLKRAHPDLELTLRERHRQMRYLSDRMKRERHAEMLAGQNSGSVISLPMGWPFTVKKTRMRAPVVP